VKDDKLPIKKDKDGKTEAEFLRDYDVNDYDRGPSLSVDNLVFVIKEDERDNVRKLGEKQLQILLIKRDEHPYIDCWSLPGTFVKFNETLEDASIRALKDKTSIEGIHLEQLGVFDEVKRDPRPRIISIGYICLMNKEVNHLQGNRGECDWFTIKQNDDKRTIVLENEQGIRLKIEYAKKDRKIVESKSDLAFDHGKLIYVGLEKLRNSIEKDDLAFTLMPEKFTIAQLQQVYEVVLDKKFTKANFTRKIKDKIVETDEYFNGGFRPAKLYKHKETDNENKE